MDLLFIYSNPAASPSPSLPLSVRPEFTRRLSIARLRHGLVNSRTRNVKRGGFNGRRLIPVSGVSGVDDAVVIISIGLAVVSRD